MANPLTVSAQGAQLAPNAPQDKPVHSDSPQRAHAALAPYIERARATYPQARDRYLAGLPRGESFFVTLSLRDDHGTEEMVFLLVKAIGGGYVNGTISNRIERVEGYWQGEMLAFPEGQIVDWLITKPDGSEEGNVVGKFMESHGDF